jgi:hypothetical protein
MTRTLLNMPVVAEVLLWDDGSIAPLHTPINVQGFDGFGNVVSVYRGPERREWRRVKLMYPKDTE